MEEAVDQPHGEVSGPVVQRIVQRLERLPLAIELAGARALSLAIEQCRAVFGDQQVVAPADHRPNGVVAHVDVP